jgi:two-component system phosphate regulon sensor histidine kinase PhoR
MFRRVFLTFCALVIFSVVVLGTIVLSRVERHYLEQVEESLATRATLVVRVVGERPSRSRDQLQAEMQALGSEIDTRITLLKADGEVVADSEEDPRRMENHADRPEVQEAGRAGQGSATRFSQTLQQRMMYLALRVPHPVGPVAYVRMALPLDKVEGRLAVLRRIVWTGALVTGLAALALSFALARRINQPVEELTAGAERIAAGGYGHKVYGAGRGKLGMLARMFNHMSDRLAFQFAQLEEDREQLRTILSGMVEGVIALDGDRRILFVNDRAAQLLGFPAQVPPGRKLGEVVRQRALQQIARRALAEPEPIQEELTWTGPAAKSITVHAARLPGNPPRGAVLVVHDTTELRRLERLRQEFVANVSHELKTPLSVIKACVETLLETADEDPVHRRRFLTQIDDQAERLHALILDLLSLARVESGTELFEFQAVSVGRVVSTCLERHRARAEAKDLYLQAIPPGPRSQESGERRSVSSPCESQASGVAGQEVSAGSSLPPDSCLLTPKPDLAVWADEEAVGQILDNLVDNALKYTPPTGRVCVRWQVEDGYVRLEVADSGIGIPEHDLPRIFERFYRVDKARSRELGGTGLGLSIVKHLAQAMHGTVHATSTVGQGTTFNVRLPQAR